MKSITRTIGFGAMFGLLLIGGCATGGSERAMAEEQIELGAPPTLVSSDRLSVGDELGVDIRETERARPGSTTASAAEPEQP
jgi:hypothetical protein